MTQQCYEDSFITLRHVHKKFHIGIDTVPIFDELNLSIAQGDFVAVMGPSGSGKSTLLNMLAGIDSPDHGEISIGKSRLDQMGETALSSWRADNMGIVFQFYNLMPMLNAAENIEVPLLLKPLSSKQRHIRVEKVLDLVGLAGREKQYPLMMSGGQQQRVGIARAIVSDPDLLLCDEPTGDLDRNTSDEILQMLSLLNRELGKTIIMVTHDARAAEYAHRTLHLDKGNFIEQKRTV